MDKESLKARIQNRKAAVEKAPDEEHVVKMWTPINIKVDENYKFIPTNKFAIAMSNGLKSFAMPVLKGLDKVVFDLEVLGKENLEPLKDKGYITVCNHVNILDCSMIATAIGRKDMTFTAIKENFEIPFVRLFVKGLGAIPIPRTVKAMQKFNAAVAELLQNNHIVHFYPEGVLFPYYNGIRGFHRGAFSYSSRSNVPIVPLLITYHEPKSKLRKKPVAKIHIMPPVYPNTELDHRGQINDLRVRVTEMMQDKFDDTDCLRDNTAVIEKYKGQMPIEKID